MATKKKATEQEVSVEDKLKSLHKLQSYLSEIDRIKTMRGELPLEVADLDDEIAGLGTRINNFELELKQLDENSKLQKGRIETSKAKIEKYTKQLDNVRNSKEYDHLSKEIEFETLEIELSEKHIREYGQQSSSVREQIAAATELLKEKTGDLEHKKKELEEIVSENKVQEEKLREKVKKTETTIEPRLLAAFKRIRKNARNGLGVVPIQRGACGGCFNKIPPQKQMDIKMGKKIIVCEYCGRIMIDPDMAGVAEK
ncbi:MAG: C4-type zinc ribbon domain-containing protein [Proteiniphilum sp.]|nr:C4-type zinc ribbon domain-containing protein [Proteiniphilum sp.]MDD3968702.1 C4-type zinc ribbon domain-containing protein [Proteiniphilum sp.]MDD4458984.1 C4-type zinc ribbon domain-containing protein [Proteiniphilum sp.]